MNGVSEILENSVQINNGLTQTSSDGASLAFDIKYGIMFCAYMPGYHGDYGESRGRISLSYFPASQPTNIRHVDVVSGHDVYVPNIIGLGDGRVRVIYEKNSRDEGNHPICYKDFDYITETLSEEKTIMLKKEDSSVVPLGLSYVFEYLEEKGYVNHDYLHTEQIIIGGGTFFRSDDGMIYGSVPSFNSEVVLFRSGDDMATVEFFAVYPRRVQYEFDYKFLNGKIYAVYRTDQEKNGNTFTVSLDNGKTWTEPRDFPDSIQCRPRIIVSGGRVIMAYNYFNPDCGNRPSVIMGRSAIKICTVDEADNPVIIRDLHSKYGIVNIALTDVLGDVYMAYSTSELALAYQNYNGPDIPIPRGKDAIRYVKLGDLC